MGKIADAIEEVEDELADLKEEYKGLQKEYEKEVERSDELEELVAKLRGTIEQYNAMEDYLEEYHPGIITAFEVANRMEQS